MPALPHRDRLAPATALAAALVLGAAACVPAALDGAARRPYPARMNDTSSSHWTVDRLEDEDHAVLEADAGTILNVPATWLPATVREGDVLRVEVGGAAEDEANGTRAVRFVRDEAETDRRREAARDLRDSLPTGPEGDLDL